MRFRLRTLLILLAVLPPLLAGGWWGWQKYLDYRRQRMFDELIELITTTIEPETWESAPTDGLVSPVPEEPLGSSKTNKEADLEP